MRPCSRCRRAGLRRRRLGCYGRRSDDGLSSTTRRLSTSSRTGRRARFASAMTYTAGSPVAGTEQRAGCRLLRDPRPRGDNSARRRDRRSFARRCWMWPLCPVKLERPAGRAGSGASCRRWPSAELAARAIAIARRRSRTYEDFPSWVLRGDPAKRGPRARDGREPRAAPSAAAWSARRRRRRGFQPRPQPGSGLLRLGCYSSARARRRGEADRAGEDDALPRRCRRWPRARRTWPRSAGGPLRGTTDELSGSGDGGERGRGWALGAASHESDLFATLEAVRGRGPAPSPLEYRGGGRISPACLK